MFECCCSKNELSIQISILITTEWDDRIPQMNLSMTGELAAAYKSGSQRAGKVTEAWGADNFYCANCSSSRLTWLKPGTAANDYQCPSCGFWYQLKSKKSPIGKSVRDGAYRAMMDAIKEDRAPNYFFLHYDLDTWSVKNLILVPHFAFPPSAIIECPPLSATARRAGWVGCNFALNRIPAEARIPIVTTMLSPSPPRSGGEGRGEVERLKSPLSDSLPVSRGDRVVIAPPDEVRARFQKVKPFQEIPVEKRGWMLDVLNVVRRLAEAKRPATLDCGDMSPLSHWETCLPVPKRGHARALQNTFTTAEVYAFAPELEKLHPGNRHIRDKIRQQLQVLRDLGFLSHVERGEWRLK
jgi:type II restriction enzyme